MSKRHEGNEIRYREELHHSAKGASQRDDQALHSLEGPVSPDEIDDLYAPPPPKRPHRHHDPDKASKSRRDTFAHWKTKDWKRRKLRRAQRNRDADRRARGD